jgi:hypothetical protein
MGTHLVVDAGAEELTAAVMARDVPSDPSASPDVVLKVGYQLLKKQIASRAGSTR